MKDPMYCINPDHAHDGPASDETWTEQMMCNDCDLPVHYDEGIEDYQHDDPSAPDCFLVRKNPEATPCVNYGREVGR